MEFKGCCEFRVLSLNAMRCSSYRITVTIMCCTEKRILCVLTIQWRSLYGFILFTNHLLYDKSRSILSIFKIRVIIRINCLYQIVWNSTKWFLSRQIIPFRFQQMVFCAILGLSIISSIILKYLFFYEKVLLGHKSQ